MMKRRGNLEKYKKDEQKEQEKKKVEKEADG